MAKIKKKIEKGGYELKGIHLRLEGPISDSNESVIIKNKFNDQTFVLVDSNERPWTSSMALGKEETIQGYIPKEYIMDVDSDDALRVRVKTKEEMGHEPPEIPSDHKH